MASKRRQTLATGLKPPMAASSGASISSSTTRRPASRGRKSMIPRVAGAENEINGTSTKGRKSMGVLPPSRKSIGRKSIGGPLLSAAPSTRTASASTPSKNRRVSLAPADHIDPRVKDKPYLSNAIKKMIAYLKRHGYDTSNFNPAKLASHGVSGRDFNSIMTFLIRRIDPTFNTSSNVNARSDEPPLKFEEEVSLAYKTLGYPFPISKTGIVAVGAPHTWPALVAAIDWLVDMLGLIEGESARDWMDDPSTEEELYTLESNENRATRQFDAYLRESMPAFLTGREERCMELEAELLEVWERDDQRCDEYLEEIEKECGGMKVEIAELERDIDGLSEAHQKREGYAQDIEKYMALVDQLKGMQLDHQTELNTLNQEKEEMERKMEEISNNIARLQQVVGKQELTVDDVRKMERQKVRLEEMCAQKQMVLDGHLNAIKEAEEQYARCMELLNGACEEYNSKARMLEMVPETAKNAHGKKLEIAANDRADSLVGLLGVDVESVTCHVKKVADDYLHKAKEEKIRARELMGKMKSLEAESEELEHEIETMKYKIKTRQEESAAELERLQSETHAKQRQRQLLETKITTLNDPSGTEDTIAKYNKRYQELLVLQKKQHEENVAKKKALSDEIRMAIDAAVEFEKFAQQIIAERNAYAIKKKEELKLELPAETK